MPIFRQQRVDNIDVLILILPLLGCNDTSGEIDFKYSVIVFFG